jgi:hypothetical protein
MEKKLADLVSKIHLAWTIATVTAGTLSILASIFYPNSLLFKWSVLILTDIVFTTLISQILWLACPMTVLEKILMTKHDHHRRLLYSASYNFLKKTFETKYLPLIIPFQLISTLTAVTIILFRIKPYFK